MKKNKPIRVGIDKRWGWVRRRGERVKKETPWTYGHLRKCYPPQWEEWIKISEALPLPFDLVDVRTPKKTVSAWWDGKQWDGYRLREEDEVLEWHYKGDC